MKVPYLDKDSNQYNDPKQAVSWNTISDPLEIEERLMERNITHFGQAHGTLKQKFGYNGVEKAVDDLM
jgi:hypothetical protein